MAKNTLPRVTWDGTTVTVRITEDTREARFAAARGLATKAAGTIMVGKLVSCEPVKGGYLCTWRPDLAKVSRPVDVDASTVKAQTTREASGPCARRHGRAEALRAELARITARIDALAMLTPGTKAAPKAAREVPPAVAERKARQAAAKCSKCEDLGVVRKHGENAGGAYKGAKGAAWALENGTGVACTCKAGKAHAA
jgi:hypothetical protein